jgi:hypothetical protein
MDSRNPRPRALTAALLIVLALGASLSSGCIVIALHPAYDDRSIAWEDDLLGDWRAAEDNVEVRVERGEWRSYRVHYKHPVEEADFTAHLTAIGDSYFLDLMPLRGNDHGAVLIPAHIIVRVARQGQGWQVSAIDYDRARESLKTGGGPPAAFDQRHNVVLTGDTAALRQWLRAASEKDFSAAVVFERAGK